MVWIVKKTPQEIEAQRRRLKEKQKRKEAEKKKLQKLANEKMKAKLEKKKVIFCRLRRTKFWD